MNFYDKFSSASTIWYPASGYCRYDNGSLDFVAKDGYYWSASPNGIYAYGLYFNYHGGVAPSSDSSRSFGYSVRCLQE